MTQASQPSLRLTVRALDAGLGLFLMAYALSDHPMYGGGPGFGATQGLILLLGLGFLAAAALAPLRLGLGVFVLGVTSLVLLLGIELLGEVIVGPMIRAPYQADEKLLFELRPGARSGMRLGAENGGVVVFHEVNEDGFRGPPLLPVKSRPRVVVYGDSFIHAAYTKEEETFVHQLGQALERSVGPVEAINAGVSSYGPDQISLRLETELEKLRPDVLVLAVFAGNDYGDLMRNKMFRIGDDGQLEKASYVLDQALITSFDLSERSSIVISALKKLKRLFVPEVQPMPEFTGERAAYQRVDFWVENAQREYKDFILDNNPVVTNVYVDYYAADLSVDPKSESGRYKAQLMKLVVARIAEQCRAADVALVLVSIPHPMDAAEGYEFTQVDRDRYPRYDRRNLIRPLAEVAEDTDVPHVSIFDVFEAHGQVGDLYLRGGDDHWNAEGQRIAAEAVAARILEIGVLSAATQNGS